jgi:hypothetical protein
MSSANTSPIRRHDRRYAHVADMVKTNPELFIPVKVG